jgi:hypothetical protein
MYQANPTEMFRERQVALVREAEDRRLARRRRRRRRASASKSEGPWSERQLAGFRRAIALLLQ